eukprot:747594-Hanusia_phi.AAC.1
MGRERGHEEEQGEVEVAESGLLQDNAVVVVSLKGNEVSHDVKFQRHVLPPFRALPSPFPLIPDDSICRQRGILQLASMLSSPSRSRSFLRGVRMYRCGKFLQNYS